MKRIGALEDDKIAKQPISKQEHRKIVGEHKNLQHAVENNKQDYPK